MRLAPVLLCGVLTVSCDGREEPAHVLRGEELDFAVLDANGIARAVAGVLAKAYHNAIVKRDGQLSKQLEEYLKKRDQAVAQATVRALDDAGSLLRERQPVPVNVLSMPERGHLVKRDEDGQVIGSIERDAPAVA